MSTGRTFVWYRHGRPFRVTDNKDDWSGSTFIEGDVVEEVYRPAQVEEGERRAWDTAREPAFGQSHNLAAFAWPSFAKFKAISKP